MFERLALRVEAKARDAVETAQRHVEDALAQLPGLRIRRDRGMLVIEAMGLVRRWLTDIRLRFALWSGR